MRDGGQTVGDPQFADGGDPSAITVNDYRALVSSSWNLDASSQIVTGHGAFISFSFQTSTISDPYLGRDFLNSFQPLTDAQKASARAALEIWGRASGITFIEVPSGMGDIRFSNFDVTRGGPTFDQGMGYAYPPGTGLGGDVFIGRPTYDSLYLFLHEIGIALGLKHPTEGEFVLGSQDNNYATTVMSHNAGGLPGNTLGRLDVEAIQYLYGTNERDGSQVASWSFDTVTNTLTRTGFAGVDIIRAMGSNNIVFAAAGADNIYGNEFRDEVYGEDGSDYIWGEGGDDVLDGGADSDRVFGGDGNDVVRGGSGADTIDGGAGSDFLDGGAGNDNIYDILGDTLNVDGGEGGDTLQLFLANPNVPVSYSLADAQASGAVRNVERSQFSGGNGADRLIGGSTGDFISGQDGDDVIEGREGQDFLYGGSGNDVISGGEEQDFLYGGSGNDVLSGGEGSDYLYGDAGVDVLSGGNDDDTLGDEVAELLNIDGGAGQDRLELRTSNIDTVVTFSLASAMASGSVRNIEFVSISGSNLADIITGAFTPDTLHGQGGDDVLGGGGGDDILDGEDGNDALDGGEGRDLLYGGEGNDLLRGGTGADSLYGGAGFDVAQYSGVRRQYLVEATIVPGLTFVSGNEDGRDSLYDVEQARFVDGVLTFDASSASAQIMRLYSATLNRTPDQAGLEANVTGLGRVGLQAMADTFVASAEFQARFGALSNQQFVEQLYVFSLGRAGDPGGIAGWVGALNGGATRGQVVLGFSESHEHQNRTAATLNAGLWAPDAQAQIIARMYDATFDRLPDVGGLTAWTANLKAGMSLIDIATAFASAAEFQQRYGAVSNEQFVRQMYQFCLNREPDPGGLAGWVNALNTGTSRAQMLLNFSESAEHIALTAASWLGGIRFDGLAGAPLADDSIVKGIDDAQVLPGIVDDGLVYDPADLGLGILDKDVDAFVLPATPDGGFQPIMEPADPFEGLDLVAQGLSVSNDGYRMLILPEGSDWTGDFDLNDGTPNHREHWLM